MAELEFILTATEQSKLVEFLFEDGAKLIPHMWYKEPKYKELSSVDEILNIRATLSGPIFVVWDEVFQYPLEFSKIDKEEGVFYFLCQKKGGPYLDFLPCGIIEDDNGLDFINGFVAYYTEYWIDKEIAVPIPEFLKKKYKQITKFIRSMGTKLVVRECKRSYWVGREALEMLQSGDVRNSFELLLPDKYSIHPA